MSSGNYYRKRRGGTRSILWRVKTQHPAFPAHKQLPLLVTKLQAPGFKPAFPAPLCEAGPDSANPAASPVCCLLGRLEGGCKAGGDGEPASCFCEHRPTQASVPAAPCRFSALSFIAPLAALFEGPGPRALGPSCKTGDPASAEQGFLPSVRGFASWDATCKLLSLRDSHLCPLFPRGHSSTLPLLPS